MSLVLLKQGYLLSLNQKNIFFNDFLFCAYKKVCQNYEESDQKDSVIDVQVIFFTDIQACFTLQYIKFEQPVIYTAWKGSKYGVIPVPYFPVFGLNTDSKPLYSVWIQENTDQK